MEYAVVDIETTGLSRYVNRITELAAVKVRDGAIVAEHQTLVDPQERIPRFITRLTGIDDALVKGAPTIEEALPGFLRFLGPRVVVAHNASFDCGFLRHNATLQQRAFTNESLCTRRLANRLVPELPSKRLSALCEHFRIRNEAAHRAMGDVRATHELFLRFDGMLKARGIVRPEEMLRFSVAQRRRETSSSGS